MGLPDKAQVVFDKAVELDKKILKKIEDKLKYLIIKVSVPTL